MGYTYDLLGNMEDVANVDEAPSAVTTPGDLGALAAVADRLSKCTKDEANWGTKDTNSPPRHRQSQTSNKEPHERSRDEQAVGPRKANAALPHDLFFTVPQSCRAGQPVCVQGPHGPLRMPLPQGYQPGERCRFRFGPAALHVLSVPEGGKPGDVVKFEGPDGEELEAKVPRGKEPGDVFEVSPPVMMVQVPKGAQSGDELVFLGPEGSERKVIVPQGTQATQYFPVQI